MCIKIQDFFLLNFRFGHILKGSPTKIIKKWKNRKNKTKQNKSFVVFNYHFRKFSAFYFWFDFQTKNHLPTATQMSTHFRRNGLNSPWSIGNSKP